MPLLFTSYKRDDKVAVTKITDRLHREFYYDIWIDAVSIPGGEDWRAEIRSGIDRADVVLLMLTPDACASAQVKEEVDYARSVGRKIVPLMIKKVDNDDLNKLGVEAINYIDFVTSHDDTFAWKKLLEALPEVLPIHKRLLDPQFKALHHDYLRSLFTRYGKIKLTYLLDAAPREQVSLFDVYVRLKLGVSFTIWVQNGEMQDWGLYDQSAEPIRDMQEMAAAAGLTELKSLKGFNPQGSMLPIWVEKMRAEWAAYKRQLEESEAKKAEKDRKTLRNGRYYWNRIESEIAPALSPHVVITGGPGSGKSTLMQHLALCMSGDMLGGDEARADLNALGFWQPLPAYTPVFVELRALTRAAFPDLRDAVTLEKFYAFLDSEQLKPYGASLYLEDLKAQMREGSAMFFLDGLDEVPEAGTPERREQIKAFVALLREQFPKCRIVVTSRPYAYAGDWQLDGFGQVDLAALDPDRLEELALKLFTVVLGEEAAKAQAEAFKQQVGRVPERLRGSPLFFTLMAAIWLNQQNKPADNRLPLSEDAIYRACVEMLVRRWTRKDLDGKQSVAELIGLDERQLRQLLELLAYQVHSENGESDDEVFTGGKIFDAVKALKLRRVDFDLLEETLAQRAGVIYEREPNKFQFAHLSFQEHLAACHLTAPEHYPARIVEHLRDNPTRWRNVMALFPHEARQQGRDLWELIKLWLPKNAVLPTQSDVPEWAGIYHAARLLHDHLPADHELQDVYRPRLGAALVKLIAVGALPPTERAEMGRLLAVLGDSRPGVGLRPDGLPDLDWVTIPDDGVWTYQNEKHPGLATFQISRYPITYAQFQAFIDAPDGFHDGRWWEGLADDEDRQKNQNQPGKQAFPYANHPRERVSWYDAIAFCRWLSFRLGGGYDLNDVQAWKVRLPTEREWEKAARGTDGRVYPYGNEFDAAKGNTDETGIGQTSAVGMFPDGASPYGVQDMSGNVWEWCLNKYNDPAQTAVDASGDYHVLRGGSFSDDQYIARAVNRNWNLPDLGFRNYGFRVVAASPT